MLKNSWICLKIMKQIIKNYKFWYLIISIVLAVALFFIYQEFNFCSESHLSGQVTGPNFCGVAGIMLFIPIALFWFSMTLLLTIREIYKKKGKIIFSGYRFWFYSVILSIILIITLIVISIGSNGLVNMLT